VWPNSIVNCTWRLYPLEQAGTARLDSRKLPSASKMGDAEETQKILESVSIGEIGGKTPLPMLPKKFYSFVNFFYLKRPKDLRNFRKIFPPPNSLFHPQIHPIYRRSFAQPPRLVSRSEAQQNCGGKDIRITIDESRAASCDSSSLKSKSGEPRATSNERCWALT